MKGNWKKRIALVLTLVLILSALPATTVQAAFVKAYELVCEPSLNMDNIDVLLAGASGNMLFVRTEVYAQDSGAYNLVTIEPDGSMKRTGSYKDYLHINYMAGSAFNEEGYACVVDQNGKMGISNKDGWVLNPADYPQYLLDDELSIPVGHYISVNKIVGSSYSGPHKALETTYRGESLTCIIMILDLETMQEIDYPEVEGVEIVPFYTGGGIIPGYDENDECLRYYDMDGKVLFQGKGFDDGGNFENGYAWVIEDGVWELINEDGAVVWGDYSHRYDGELPRYGNYFSTIAINVHDGIMNMRGAYLNVKGDTIREISEFVKYGDCSPLNYQNGYARISIIDPVIRSVYGDALIDTTGRMVISPENNLSILGDVSEDGYFLAREIKSYEYYDYYGRYKYGPLGLYRLNEDTIHPDAVRYVPYSVQLSSQFDLSKSKFSLVSGALPAGLSLSETGEIYGVPTKSGTYQFTVQIDEYKEPQTIGGSEQRTYTMKVKNNTSDNVTDAPNVPEGYVIKKEVKDMTATSVRDQVLEIKSYSDEAQTVEKENFGDFMEVYLDGRRLVGGKLVPPMTPETIPAEWEYYAEKGSTKITIRSQTFSNTSTGTHTIAAEFREGGVKTGEMKTVAQNFQISTAPAYGGGGGGGGGSSSRTITVTQTVGGKITVTPEKASAGTTVTIKATPDLGYRVSAVTVSNAELTKVDETTYTFVMPKASVEIKGTFERIPAAYTPFIDVSEEAWYYPAVRFVYENGYMQGVAGNSFAPDKTMTRAMLLTVLARYAGVDVKTTGKDWYEQSVKWAVENGISNGKNVMEDITREQIATILYRFSGEPETEADLSKFGDQESVSGYALKAMQWAVANGLINGVSGKLAPQEKATRAQLAAMIMRYCENIQSSKTE